MLIKSTVNDVDKMAENIALLAKLGHDMPPSWQGAEMTHPVNDPEHRYLGKILPGKGLYLDCDLKYFGIDRPIPHVYERSLTRYLIDLLGNQRGSITTYDGIISARASGLGQDILTGKVVNTVVAGNWSSLLKVTGLPGAFTYSNISGTPGAGGSAPTRADSALSLGLANPTSSRKKYLLSAGFSSSTIMQLALIHDLLVAADLFDTNSASSQGVNTTALTRYTTGEGVMMTWEVTNGTIGATPRNLTVTYTDQSGNGSSATPAQALTASAIDRRLQPTLLGPFMQLAAGDYGVRSVESAQLSGTMGTASRYIALNMYMPLMFLPGVNANTYAERDSTLQIDGITELVQTSGNVIGCINAFVMCSTTSAGPCFFFFRTCEG